MRKIERIKKEMLEWRDFYDADIFYTGEIKKAKTEEDLKAVLSMYAKHMEDRECDARSHFDDFVKSLRFTDV
jgi:hypothetical protein